MQQQRDHSDSPDSRGKLTLGMSEYQSRMKAQEKPDFQRKLGGGKKFVTPSYAKHKEEKLSGVGMLVLSQKPQKDEILAFNKQTNSRYNGRKRQYVDFSFAKESTSLMHAQLRNTNNQNQQESSSKEAESNEPKPRNFHYMQ